MDYFWRRNSTCVLFPVIILIAGIIMDCGLTHGYMLGNDPTRRAEYLDPDGKFLLEWEPLWSTRRIVFNVTVQTRGYVALGLSSGAAAGASGGGGEVDLVIAGVLKNGKAYFLDHHMSTDGEGPRLDASQDYTLHTAWESGSHTFVSFSRPLDTCDSHDYPITDNRVSIVWGYGDEDNHEFSWQYSKRGRYDLYLLDPDYSPNIVRRPNGDPVVESNERLQAWTISKQARIPSNDTSYLCSMHRGPTLQTKHHVVGFDVHFADQESRERVHHLIVAKCTTPQGLSSGIFEPFVDGPSENCYLTGRLAPSMPTHFCTQIFFGWAVGGRAIFTPPHVGLPIASTPNEYYILQVHYDNPQQRPNVVVDFRIDVFYTSHLRPNDGGIMSIGHEFPGLAPSLLIPPASANHRIFGHCSPECTRRMYPNNGIKIAATLLHSHKAGRRLRLHHFSSRNPRREQPWIMYDDNYSNGFQQFRHLHEERRILPGDQLTTECIYDTASTTVVGGFSTSQEMCLAFMIYYNQIPEYSFCTSDINSPEYRQQLLGITNTTWVESRLDWVATDTNSSLRGLTVQEIADDYVRWDRNTRYELQRFHESHPQVGRCSKNLYARSPVALTALVASGTLAGPMTDQSPLNLNTPDDYSGPTGYPYRTRPYVPEKACSYRGWNDKRVYGFLKKRNI